MRRGVLRSMALVAFALLIVQFLLGMWVNLWIPIPQNHPGVSPDYFTGVLHGVPWALLHGGAMLTLHVALGITLFLWAIGLVLHASRARGRVGRGWAWLGLFGIFAAAGNGASFLNFGKDFSSFLMAVGFAIALVAYAMLLQEASRSLPAGAR